MKLFHINSTAKTDITEIYTKVTWSGSKGQVARKLDFGILVSPTDANLPKIEIKAGNAIQVLDDNDKEIFQGHVFSKNLSTNSNEMTFTAYDRLIYLTKSKVAKNFKAVTAEKITQQLCTEYGVALGELAKTGISQSFIVFNKSIYETIMTAYTNASKQNGKLYIVRMIEGKLYVLEKGSLIAEKVLYAETDLTNSNYSESIEEMVNRVIITDKEGNKIGQVENSADVTDYGLIQEIYKSEDNKDNQAEAKALLKSITQEASVDVLGNVECIAGNGVRIVEKYTSLIGLFWIESDSHTWQNGAYTMSLNLDFKDTMDEKQSAEATEETKKSKSSKSKKSTDVWDTSISIYDD